MAWDLRYTSEESGPTGRSGFQFVATTPGTPASVTLAVTPYMSYRPPPDAPSAPGPAELAAFPISLAYGREGDHAVLARCRYTGRDYSGRYGNFAGHAVVATPQEMEGLRPIELWESPMWAGPAGGTPDLVPGDAFDPDSLVTWLNREGAHDRLATLLDAVTAALAGGHGRVVLVARDTGLVARWIALLSYSLPAGLAAQLSFITYTADPESAPQHVVGTVPGAWQGRGCFPLDEPGEPGEPDEAVADDARPGRFARVVTDCWRDGDLNGIDAIGELLTAGAPLPGGDALTGRVPSSPDRPSSLPPPQDMEGRPDQDGATLTGRTPATVDAGEALRAAEGAAALLALCRGDASVSADEQAAAAEVVRRGGVPGWVWPAVSVGLPGLGFELAVALAHVAPEVAEHCVALALDDPSLRERLPVLRLRDGLPSRFRTAVAGADELGALTGVLCLAGQVGGRIEDDDVTATAAACARRGAGDIAATLRDTPVPWRTAVVSGVLAGLEDAEPRTRRALLTAEASAALGDRDWTRAPRTGGLVLSARADRHDATAGLVELEPYGLPDIEELLTALWDAPPTPEDCRLLIERLGPAMARFATLRRLPWRVFESAPLDTAETLRLAELIRDRLPELAGPARIILGHDTAMRTEPGLEVARVLGVMDPDEPLTTRVYASVAGALAGRSARVRADILTAASDPVRAALTGHWLDTDRHGRVDLAEIEVRLDRARTPIPGLTEWGDGLGRFARRHVESALTDRDPKLASAWRALRRRGA